jgi:hypothetical protein
MGNLPFSTRPLLPPSFPIPSWNYGIFTPCTSKFIFANLILLQVTRSETAYTSLLLTESENILNKV